MNEISRQEFYEHIGQKGVILITPEGPKRYTEAEVYRAVREELTEANKAIGRKRFSDRDWMVMGVLACAFERLEEMKANNDEKR